jgi:hypothetical protein
MSRKKTPRQFNFFYSASNPLRFPLLYFTSHPTLEAQRSHHLGAKTPSDDALCHSALDAESQNPKTPAVKGVRT